MTTRNNWSSGNKYEESWTTGEHSKGEEKYNKGGTRGMKQKNTRKINVENVHESNRNKREE